MNQILILHGPNLNLLGKRKPEIYGSMSLKELNSLLRSEAKKLKIRLRISQSNSEGALIDLLHENRHWSEGVIINPGAYTHYSYAIRDAIEAIEKPTVEVHLSDIYKREKFRRISVIAPVCVKQFSGLGWKSYLEGIRFLKKTAISSAI